jgi:hypothetical protein
LFTGSGASSVTSRERETPLAPYLRVRCCTLHLKSRERETLSAKLEIKDALLCNREGDESIAELRSEYLQIYKWNKVFAVVINGDSTVVVATPPDIIGQEAIDINFVKRITYFEHHAFSDIRRAKGRTLYGRVCERIDNIGRIF